MSLIRIFVVFALSISTAYAADPPVPIAQPSAAERALGDELIACVQQKVGLRAALIRAQNASKTDAPPSDTK